MWDQIIVVFTIPLQIIPLRYKWRKEQLNDLWLFQMAATRVGQNGNDLIHLRDILYLVLWVGSDQQRLKESAQVGCSLLLEFFLLISK